MGPTTLRLQRLARCLAALLSAAAGAATASAQSLEPRAYANTPVGVNFAILGYAWTSGDAAVDAAVPLKNGKVQANAALLAYVRSFDFFGKSAKIDLVLPFAHLSGSADLEIPNPRTPDPSDFLALHETRRVSGGGDAWARISVNFYGAPALSAEQYESYEQDLIIGGSLRVTAPLGSYSQYDSDRVVNISSHRWAFKPELGISKSWAPFILELAVSGSFYTDNHDFFHGHERAQDPIGAVEAHAIYAFRRGIWGSLDFTYYAGGKTHIDGVSGHDLESNTRMGATLALPVNRYNSIKLFGSTGVSTRFGGNFELIGIAWQVRWGGGI